MRANQACNNGLLAASAKNGRPIESANKPISQSASAPAGGRSQPVAIESGSASIAAPMTTRWMATEGRPGA